MTTNTELFRKLLTILEAPAAPTKRADPDVSDANISAAEIEKRMGSLTQTAPGQMDQIARAPGKMPVAPKATPKPAPGAGELDSDILNRQQQITQRQLSPQEYQQKMDRVNQMRQQQGQEPLPVTPADQIATPTAQAAAPQAIARTAPTGQSAQAAPATAPKTTAPAQSASSSVQAIAKASGITDPNKINVGQKIKLPDGSEYTIARGDTLGAIAAGKFKGTAPTKPAAATPTPTNKGDKAVAPTQKQAAPATPAAPAPSAATQATSVDDTGNATDPEAQVFAQPIKPAPVNPANPSGRSSQMNITPDQARAVLDNGSPSDIAALGGVQRLQQLAGVKPTAPATAPTAQLQKGPAPAQAPAPELQKGPAPAQAPAPELQKGPAPAPTAAQAAPQQSAPGTTSRNFVPPRPVNIQQARQWARKYAQTHNPDGSPKANESADLRAMLTIAGLR